MAPSPTPSPPTFDEAFRDATAAHQSGRVADAAVRYEGLLPSAPDSPQLRYQLGAAYVELGRFHDAIGSLGRALALRPAHLPSIELLGTAWLRAGQPERSIAYFQEADLLGGRTPETANRLATALRLAGRHAEAVETYRRHPLPDILQRLPATGLAISLAALGQTAEAERILTLVLQQHPGYAHAHLALASLLGQTSRFVEAEALMRNFLAADPAHLEARRLLANAIHKQGRLDEAVAVYQEILDQNPADSLSSLQIAEALIDLSRLDEAEAVLTGLRGTDHEQAPVLTALGRIRELRGDLSGAIALHDEAIALDPSCENAFVNRGSAKRFSGHFDDALADYDAALALRPAYPPAVANRGLTLLTLGRLDEAWPYYRARIRALHGARDLSDGLAWDGSPLGGKKVLVWLEYGLGDEILFASLLPELIATVAHCTIVGSSRLRTLLERSFPSARVLGFGDKINGDFDFRLPLTDAAQWLRPALASFPKHAGYIRPDADLSAALRGRYQKGSQRRLIGISWRSAAGPSGNFKSVDLMQWQSILNLSGATFVSLQYGDCAKEINSVSRAAGCEIIQDPDIDSAGDLDEFAAQVAAMDLVLSVSNTTVHFAGALGRPVWALVPRGPGTHWYWFLNRSDNPWYPTLRLFRQSRSTDWRGPLAEMHQELTRWLGA